ncbi:MULTISPECIES: hypothetical protein [Marinomonas]|uniref:hypothetical protein n=1 Tax=Marinomonas TaxID=28253 RepID=UPI0010565690|nr:hypothetical protein [Marinomonas flavescens]
MPLSSTMAQGSKEYCANDIILGCLETLQQGRQFLTSIDDEQYCYVAAPHVASSIGGHFRHLLDVFEAVYKNQQCIDYNLRRRGHGIETSKVAALTAINQLISWLQLLENDVLTMQTRVITEVCLSKTQHGEMGSTVGRELTFAALHATHHFAMANVIVSLLNGRVSDQFGYAPSTVSYLRDQ